MLTGRWRRSGPPSCTPSDARPKAARQDQDHADTLHEAPGTGETTRWPVVFSITMSPPFFFIDSPSSRGLASVASSERAGDAMNAGRLLSLTHFSLRRPGVACRQPRIRGAAQEPGARGVCAGIPAGALRVDCKRAAPPRNSPRLSAAAPRWDSWIRGRCFTA